MTGGYVNVFESFLRPYKGATGQGAERAEISVGIAAGK